MHNNVRGIQSAPSTTQLSAFEKERLGLLRDASRLSTDYAKVAIKRARRKSMFAVMVAFMEQTPSEGQAAPLPLSKQQQAVVDHMCIFIRKEEEMKAKQHHPRPPVRFLKTRATQVS